MAKTAFDLVSLLPRYFSIVLAFAGLSTITKFLPYLHLILFKLIIQ